jgi:hypothetical protein
MADKLDRIEDKLDRLSDKVSDIAGTVTDNTTILKEHQRRSVANEKAIDLMQKELDPIKKHVAVWGVAGKIAVAIAGVAGFIAAIVQILSVFH